MVFFSEEVKRVEEESLMRSHCCGQTDGAGEVG